MDGLKSFEFCFADWTFNEDELKWETAPLLCGDAFERILLASLAFDDFVTALPLLLVDIPAFLFDCSPAVPLSPFDSVVSFAFVVLDLPFLLRFSILLL